MKRAGALVGRRALFLLLPLLPLLPLLLLLLGLGGAMAQGQYTTIEIVVKDKKFVPAEVKAPANARIVIQVKNQDAVAMEFESKSLKLEKVVAPNSEGLVRVGPLKPGKYEFFDDFNMSNRGTLIVE